jgi:predicted signal transduction protein with EAL and GGDEF domain
VVTTVSIGVAGGPAGTELEVLLAAADTALYQAKRGGRNRVQVAEEQPLSLEQGRRNVAGQIAPPKSASVVRGGVTMTASNAR